ncbi:hypothetical protein [Litchfieldia alkalitelluris]|uniref:hypothetical protein n=1 Tax=Litchfieldia alkalitelluris TaxID=304268 RepID=UPI001959334B|nr:hypothetical protein [Litchfieldia alkalitelluris]
MEVHKYLSMLTVEQQEFLASTLKQSKKSKWLEVLARSKGLTIRKETTIEELEEMIDDWVLLEVLDSGYGNRNYRCMCGAPLRYQYVVLNKKSGEEVGLGVECFKNHTNLSAQVVTDVIKEFHTLDLLRDEILVKVARKQLFDINPYLHIDNIPPTILEQAKLGIPLTDQQILTLQRLKEVYDTKIRTEKVLSDLKPEARKAFDNFSKRIKEKLIEKMLDDKFVRVLPDGFNDAEIEHFISLGFPLLDEQLERVHQFNQSIKDRRKTKNRNEVEEYWERVRKEEQNAISSIRTGEKTLNYQTLIERHLTTLQDVREKESALSAGMWKDWIKVQEIVRSCKRGEEIDYSSFKLNLGMICNSIRVDKDRYL